jgi:predicted O-methyltransferase YrrM
MSLYQTARYLNYILLSHHRRGHGIHSPFIFDLVSRIFRNKTDPGVVFMVEQVRKRMIADHRKLIINDLGSGSEKHRSNLRNVSHIARRSPVPVKYGELLSKMAAEFGKPAIIELGTSLGISTMYMALSSPGTAVYTIEGCPAIAGIAKQNFTAAELDNIRILEGSFDEILPEFSRMDVKPGLIFIDGNHRKEPVIRYFNKLSEIASDRTVFIIDDIYYSREMAEAWNVIKLHRKVSVSLDIFRMGILFFREGITPKSYTIRY